NHGQNADYRIFEDAARVQVLLCEAFVADDASRETIEMLKGFKDAFTRQAVERPKQNQVKLSTVCVSKHCLELSTDSGSASLPVDVFAGDLPALFRGKISQLDKLVFCFLALILGGYTGIESDFHCSPRRPTLSLM